MLEVRHVRTSELSAFQDDTPHESVVIMPSTRVTLARRAADVMVARTQSSGLLVIAEDDLRIGFIATANMVYAKTASRYAAYVAQDAFAGYYWLETGIRTLKESGSGLLAFNDGRFFGRLAAFGLVDRQWAAGLYGRFLFYPRYKRHYADTELSDVALLTGKMAYNPHAMMVEIDYGKHLGTAEKRAETVIEYNNTDSLGADPDGTLYVERALKGFDGKVAPFVPEMGPVAAVLKARGTG